MSAREHREQALVIRWAAAWEDREPRLKLLFAVPNGGKRNVITAAILKREGVKSGVPDLWLPVHKYLGDGEWRSGLVIEMKAPAEGDKPRGQLSPAQRIWLAALQEENFQVEVCYDAFDAERLIAEYLGQSFLVESVPHTREQLPVVGATERRARARKGN